MIQQQNWSERTKLALPERTRLHFSAIVHHADQHDTHWLLKPILEIKKHTLKKQTLETLYLNRCIILKLRFKDTRKPHASKHGANSALVSFHLSTSHFKTWPIEPGRKKHWNDLSYTGHALKENHSSWAKWTTDLPGASINTRIILHWRTKSENILKDTGIWRETIN